MSNHSKKQIDDLLERLGVLDARVLRYKAKKELTIKYLSNGNNGGVMVEQDDEFSKVDDEETWYVELAKHGMILTKHCQTLPTLIGFGLCIKAGATRARLISSSNAATPS